MPTTPAATRAPDGSCATRLRRRSDRLPKVPGFDVPIHEACDRLRRGETLPNTSPTACTWNGFRTQRTRGRESADYIMTPVRTPKGGCPRRNRNAGCHGTGLGRFSRHPDRGGPASRRRFGTSDPETWDEFDFEQVLRESDARTTNSLALYDRYVGIRTPTTSSPGKWVGVRARA